MNDDQNDLDQAAEFHQQELEVQQWIEEGCPFPIPKAVWMWHESVKREIKDAYKITG